MIQTITLIGAGNVAHNLGHTFVAAGFNVVEVYSRKLNNAKELAEKLGATFTNSLQKMNQKSDLYVIASTDNAIEEIASQLNLGNKLVVHTSGSVAIDFLKNASSNWGSLYPLQTFTKDYQADFTEIPICIEANDPENLKTLLELAQKLSNKVIELSSEQRQKLHLAAVFVSNFANYMQAIGQNLCESQGVDFDLLKPLIKEVFEKNLKGRAIENQTGPALRGDSFTMNKHLDLLKDQEELSSLYQLISDMIKNRNLGN